MEMSRVGFPKRMSEVEEEISRKGVRLVATARPKELLDKAEELAAQKSDNSSLVSISKKLLMGLYGCG